MLERLAELFDEDRGADTRVKSRHRRAAWPRPGCYAAAAATRRPSA
jgi:hypothetical protein